MSSSPALARAAVDQAVSDERRRLADSVADLTDEQWATPSLCAAWTVRDVIAHLTVTTRLTVPRPLRAAVRALADPTRTGVDRLDGLEGPAVFAANHHSHVDTPLLLTALPDRFRHRTVVGAGADYFFDKRWKGALWSFAINAIPIERTRPSPRSIRLAAGLLDDGWSLVIFPEGTRRSGPVVDEVFEGPAYLSAKLQVPIVPVGIGGSEGAMPKGSKGLRPVKTSIVVGEPIAPPTPTESGRVGRKGVRGLTEQLQQRLQVLFYPRP